MKIIIYSDNGLEYCKEKLEALLPGLVINKSNDEDFPLGETTEVDIDCIETLNDLLEINGHAYLWKETIKSNIDFYIDLTEPPMY